MSENHFMLDEIDRKILRILSVNGRINNLALAEAVNLSPTPCARRVRRLEEAGIIEGYGAQPQRPWFRPERVHRRHAGQPYAGTLCRL